MVSTIPSYRVCGRKFPSIGSIVRTSRMEKKPYASGMKTLRSIRKYGQYQCPIARRILFRLNDDTCTPPDGLCHPSDCFGSKLEILEMVAGCVCICCDERTTNGDGHCRL